MPTQAERGQEILELHITDEMPIGKVADQKDISPQRVVKHVRRGGETPLCAYCRDTVDHLPKSGILLNVTKDELYCSPECEAADNGEDIQCSDCEFSCRTVGRFRTHQDTEHPLVPDWDESMGWDRTREVVLERDDHSCAQCGISREEHKQCTGRDLDIHHILKQRLFDEEKDADVPGNLISLCRSCHGEIECMSPYGIFHFQPEA